MRDDEDVPCGIFFLLYASKCHTCDAIYEGLLPHELRSYLFWHVYFNLDRFHWSSRAASPFISFALWFSTNLFLPLSPSPITPFSHSQDPPTPSSKSPFSPLILSESLFISLRLFHPRTQFLLPHFPLPPVPPSPVSLPHRLQVGRIIRKRLQSISFAFTFEAS